MFAVSRILRFSVLAFILMFISCGSEMSTGQLSSEGEAGTDAGPADDPFESVHIVSGPNGLAHIVLNLERDGSVMLRFTQAGDDESSAEVTGTWEQENDLIRISFDETDLNLSELFCDYPSVENSDELIYSDGGYVEFKPLLNDSTPHVQLYIWGILCGAEYRATMDGDQ